MKTFSQFLIEQHQKYWLNHRPSDPRKYPDEVATADNIFLNMPKDTLTKPHYYFDMNEKGAAECIRILKALQGKPNKLVTIYRGAPSGGALNTGDWVTLSKAYASIYADDGGYSDSKQSHVYKYDNVRASDLSFDGDHICEFGYWGPDHKDGILIK